MSLKKYTLQFALISTLVSPLQLQAQENTAGSDDEESDRIPILDKILLKEEFFDDEEPDASVYIAEDPENLFFKFLDDHQKLVSNKLEQYVQGVDNFFTDDTVAYKRSGSYLRVRVESLWTEGEGNEFDAGLSLKLRLPKTQKKLKLVISSEVDEQKTTQERETGAIQEQTEEERGLYTGLERELGKPDKWRFKPSIGVKIRSPLDWYIRLRAYRDVTFEKWLMSFYQSFYWFDSTGSGSDTSLRWDRRLDERFLFRSDSFVRYTDITNYFDTSQSFSIVHTLSKRRAVTYKVAAFGISDDETTYATSYLTTVQYRQNIYKDYLFMDVQPTIGFARENEFKGEVGLFVRFEIFYK